MSHPLNQILILSLLPLTALLTGVLRARAVSLWLALVAPCGLRAFSLAQPTTQRPDATRANVWRLWASGSSDASFCNPRQRELPRYLFLLIAGGAFWRLTL